MKTMKKRNILIALFLVFVMVFGIAGCNSGNDLQSKIGDLQSRIEELEEQLRDRDATIEELNEQICEQDEKIEQLEQELAEKTEGTFCTLQEAYDNGWLTQEDLMSIAYYHNGGRMGNEEIMGEDYEPAPKTSESLSSLTELKIKNTAAKEYRKKYNTNNAEADGFTITEYCGTYGNCVAVMMRDIYSGEAGVVWTDTVAGVNINYGGGRKIQVWRETK